MRVNRFARYFVPLAFVVTVLAAAPAAHAQGGEPPYFAIRGAKVVPVSGAVVENTTILISRGVIAAIGRDLKIPDEAWIVDGKGLTVYPGLIDSFTDIGLTSLPPVPPESGTHKPSPARGPEDRPGTTPWRNAADEVNLSDKRIETWRDGGFTTVVSAPKGGFFPGQAAVLNLAGERSGDIGCEIRRRHTSQFPHQWIRQRFPGFADGRALLRPPGLARHRLEYPRGRRLCKKCARGAAPLRPDRSIAGSSITRARNCFDPRQQHGGDSPLAGAC